MYYLAFVPALITLRNAPLPLSVRKTIIPTEHQKEILNGILAGGGGKIEQQATGVRIRFEFGETSQAYENKVGEALQGIISNPASVVKRPPHVVTGNIYHSTRLGTLTLPSLQSFYCDGPTGRHRFVKDGTRVIPLDIANGFTVVSLAFMIMNSGSTHP